ncbi:hypothetical protein ID866_8699 [Astraeus odoratus]|nr:hypothetical protein ID866_8699 [Astraeus odoratus]
MDDNPRPHKRLRTDHPEAISATNSSFRQTSSPLAPPTASDPLASCHLRPLPPQVLLLALPALLAHPPNHEKYGLSLFLSLKAIRMCLQLKALAPDIECHAWTTLAEVGMRVIESGFSTSGEHGWASGIEAEVEKAIGKGLLIAQKLPSLRPLRHHLSLLNAHFAFRNQNTRFARAVLRRLISSFVASDPPTTVYAAYLTLVTQLTSTPPSPSRAKSADAQTPSTSAPELQAALTALTNLTGIAAQNQHFGVLKLAAVLRVRMLVASEMWDQVGDALRNAERALGLVFDDVDDAKVTSGGRQKQAAPDPLMRSYSITAQDVHDSAASHSQSLSQSQSDTPPRPSVSSEKTLCEVVPALPLVTPQNPNDADPLTLALTVHTLILGIIYHTHGGHARAAEPRLNSLHSLLDRGAVVGGMNSDGLVEVPLPPHPSLFLRVTHPRITFLLTYLVSAVAKRDPVGRRPKKRVFAEAGVAQCRESSKDENSDGDINSEEDTFVPFRSNAHIDLQYQVPLWASLQDVDDVDQTTHRIEADLLCELVARCDCDAAEHHLATVIAHTRTHGLFTEYAPQITLHYGHLAHVLGDTDRAATCYRVAAHLDGAGPVGSEPPLTGGFVAAAARAGEALLRIGIAAVQAGPDTAQAHGTKSSKESHPAYLDASTVMLVKDAITRCSTSSAAPLPALSDLLSAALAPSQIIRSKSMLKNALALSGAAGDNHLRALVLAFVGAQYVHTAPEHALEVLAVCETLGAGMGASAKKGSDTTNTGKAENGEGVGNAPLRLWVGERFVELFKRAGKENRVWKQEEFNACYRSAVDGLRGRSCW